MNTREPLVAVSRERETFGRPVRLVLNRDFQDVFGNQCSVAGLFMVVWIRRRQCPGVRMGVIASKRTFRRAVDRNRAKRLVREAFRKEQDVFQDAMDIVIVARKRILRTDVPTVRVELHRLVNSLGMRRGGE